MNEDPRCFGGAPLCVPRKQDMTSGLMSLRQSRESPVQCHLFARAADWRRLAHRWLQGCGGQRKDFDLTSFNAALVR